MRAMPFLLLPAVVLVAQAPATPNLAQRFNSELAGITQLLKELKTQEALAKVQALMPSQRPGFDVSSGPAMSASLDNAQGLMSLYKLQAKVTSEAGLWEKALEVQEKRAADARAIKADQDKVQAPILAQWAKVSQESRDYIAKNEPRKKELESGIAAFKAEFATVSAEVKSGKRKLTKKELDEFNARGSKVQQDEQDLAQINASLPVHKQNLDAAPKVAKMLGENTKEMDGMIKAADEAVAKAKTVVTEQNDEITAFNTKQVMQKVKIVGKKNWVDAVLRNHENFTKLGSTEDQAAFLNRLLVLDPGNAMATKALDNLKAGKEPFAKEAKSGKKSPKK